MIGRSGGFRRIAVAAQIGCDHSVVLRQLRGRLLHDIAVGDDGTVYVSDSRAQTVYRVTPDGVVDPWLELGAGRNPNGLLVDGDRLLVAVNPEHAVLAIDRSDRTITTFAVLPSGLTDGLEAATGGAVLASQNEGRLLLIAPDGAISTLLDTTVVARPCADIESVPELDLVLIPTYVDGRLVAYRVPMG